MLKTILSVATATLLLSSLAFGANGKPFEELDSKISKNTDDIMALKKQVSTSTEIITTIQSDNGNIKSQLDFITLQLGSMNERITALEACISCQKVRSFSLNLTAGDDYTGDEMREFFKNLKLKAGDFFHIKTQEVAAEGYENLDSNSRFQEICTNDTAVFEVINDFSEKKLSTIIPEGFDIEKTLVKNASFSEWGNPGFINIRTIHRTDTDFLHFLTNGHGTITVAFYGDTSDYLSGADVNTPHTDYQLNGANNFDKILLSKQVTVTAGAKREEVCGF